MGFWHTGYMEFHEATGEGGSFRTVFRPPTFPCAKCGVTFSSENDLRIHAFEGHATPRPILIFKGRECGRARLIITAQALESDWVLENAVSVTVNGRATDQDEAIAILTAQRSGVTDVMLVNGDVSQTFQFEFALADEADLLGVDGALDRLIDSSELSLRSIDDFIMRSRRYPTASRYLAGLANYLYGVLAREGISETQQAQHLDGEGYEGKYDRAVVILGSFDRVPAEAICGIVAFHYNQFQRAMHRTRSQRVAEVALRFQSALTGESLLPEDLTLASHSSLDFSLSDSVIEQVLEWSAIPLDGTATKQVRDMTAQLDSQRPSDAFKLHLIAAEHFLARGEVTEAASHAEALRHSRHVEEWYSHFRSRLQGAIAR